MQTQVTTESPSPSKPTVWHHVVGTVHRRKHVETSRTTGAAGTYVGFACGLTFSVAALTAPFRADRPCATCARVTAR